MVHQRLGATRGWARRAACLLGAVAFAPAQQPPAPAPAQPTRIAHVVRVRDAAGAPVPDAEVTLVSGESYSGFADADLVRGTTGPDGRARLQVLATASYRGWAIGPGAKGPTATPCRPAGNPTTELQFAAPPAAAAQKLAMQGLEAWRSLGPVQIEIRDVGGRILVPAIEVPPDGAVPVPPQPNELVEVRVFVAGHCVFADHRNLEWSGALPPPQRVVVATVDGEGKPVAGVRLFRVNCRYVGGTGPFPEPPRGDRQLVGTTGDDGKATVLVASEKDPRQGNTYPPFLLVASKDGCRETYAAGGQSYVLDGEIAGEGADQAILRLTMKVEAPAAVKVLGMPTGPAGVVFGHGSRHVPLQKNSFTSIEDIRPLPVEQGALQLPAQAGRHLWQAFVMRWTPEAPAANDPFRRVLVPRPLVIPGEALGAGGTLDLAKVVPLRLQVLDATAGPVAGAWVLCVPKYGTRLLAPQFCARATTDSAGRAVFPVLPPGCLVLVVHDDLFGKVSVDAGKLPEPLVLTVQPMERMKVRVVDGNGEPIAGASFATQGASWRGGGDAEQQLLTELGNQLVEWGFGKVKTDKDGLADLPFLPSRWLRIDFVATVAGRRSGGQQLVAGEDRVDIVVK